MMIIRLFLLFLLWLFVRRLWRAYVASGKRSSSRRQAYPGPPDGSGRPEGHQDITQQKIVDAEYEELDDERP